MPIPTPHHDKKSGHRTESKSQFISRCMGDAPMVKEYEQEQRAAICYSKWKEHKAKASLVVVAGDEEYASFPPDAKESQLPDDKRKLPPQHGQDSSPAPLGKDEGGPIPPPKKTPPSGIAPAPDDTPIKTTENPGDSPDLYDDVSVQASSGDDPALFPYGTKCPTCGRPTVQASNTDLHRCAVGHGYTPDKAVPVGKTPSSNTPTTFTHELDQLGVHASAEKHTKLHIPENWDKVPELSCADFVTHAGANDWENTWSACAFQFHSTPISHNWTRRVWAHIHPPAKQAGQVEAKKPLDHGRHVVESWVKLAKARRDTRRDPNLPKWTPSHTVEDFTETARHVHGLASYGVEKVQWVAASKGWVTITLTSSVVTEGTVKHQPRDADIAKRAKQASNPPVDHYPNPQKGGPHAATNPENATTPSANQPGARRDEADKPGHHDGVKSLEDNSAKPDLDKMQWYMASETMAYAIDPETGIAKWPLQFKQIEKDFKRPNKVRDKNAELKHNKAAPKAAIRDMDKNHPTVI